MFAHELSLGLGVRIPTGKDDAKSNGITLSEDMHPSVGAVGKILWTSYSYAFNQAATLQLNTSANYTYNDENDRDYSFGDEFNFAFGISQSIGTKFGYSAALRYRSTRRDRRIGFQIPNTGGKWLDFVPAVQYAVTDSLTIGLNGRIPIARNLNDAVQFTTSYSYGLSATYGF
ncbi:MAG: transporter [Gammaproteobacteria bacterium]|nr:transporter [Gammaproteobacteria bacterium]MDP7455403.1 transporter [Gammaproteobacteria bacterium]